MNFIGKLSAAVGLIAGMMYSSLAPAQIQPGSRPGKSSAVGNRALITLPTSQNNTMSGRPVNLQFPQGTEPETVKVVLNGRNVSDRFQELACSGNVCLSAVLTDADGLRQDQNVVYATAKNQDGTASSSRLRFEGSSSEQNTNGVRALAIPRAAAITSTAVSLPTLSSFLPPAVALNTIYVGGANPNSEWLRVGTQEALATGSCGQQIYSVIVLDRQTLIQKTPAPENSPQCFNDNPTLYSYLKGLAGLNDVVILGTNASQQANAPPYNASAPNAMLDTTLIGGTVYNCSGSSCPLAGAPNVSTSGDIPLQYITIGVPGAKPGSAYENYTTATNTTAYAYATGMFVEDASGNYNFQSSGNVEYMVQPGQTAAQAYIQINNPPSINYQVNSSNANVVFWPPSISNTANGFWLLVLDRNNLSAVGGCQPNMANNGQIIVPNCG
jgi:hypothetical protein